MIEFKKYEAIESTLVDQGTVKENAGKGGKIALIRKNWNNHAKRVAVLITNGKGLSAVVPCSQQVSEALRAKKLSIAQLLGLSIVETTLDDGSVRNFISMPATGAVYEKAVDTVKVEEVALTAASLEELIAL